MILEFGEVAGGDDKLKLDLVRLLKINCTCTGDSFEGTDFVCWLKLISYADFAEIVCRFRQVFVGVQLRFGKSSPR